MNTAAIHTATPLLRTESLSVTYADSSRASGFASFDQRLAKRARRVVLTPPVQLLV